MEVIRGRFVLLRDKSGLTTYYYEVPILDSVTEAGSMKDKTGNLSSTMADSGTLR